MRITALLRATAVVAAITGLAVLGLGNGVFEGFQHSSTDVLFPRGEIDPRIVVVGIDAEALAVAATPWPWPRDLQAELVAAVGASGPAAIGLDVVLAEPGADDTALVDTVRTAGNVVAVAVPSGLVAGSFDLQQAVALAEPYPALADEVTVAHAVITADRRDGVARTAPLVIETPDGRFLPSLALALASIAEGAAPVPIVRPGSVQMGSISAPTEAGHALTLSYGEGLGIRGSDHYLSAARLLSGEVGADDLAGKIVLIGVADPTLGDHHRTPGSKGSGEPGVFIHAHALNTLLGSTYLERASDGETLVWCVLLTALVVAVSQRFRLRWAPIVAALAMLGYLVATSVRFDAGVVMDPVYPLLAAVLALAGGLSLRYLTETRQKRRVSALFSRYVPASVAEDLLADNERTAAVLSGQRLRVTVLFCDLRGFTDLAGTLPADDVRRLLDAYYHHVTVPVLERGGTVMQFVGDEVYAVFGAPLPTEHPEQLGLDCALAMQGAQPGLAAALVADGLPPVEFGIGVHTGEAVAAQVGTDVRSQYSVVGHVVNVGSRLCSIAGPGAVVVSAAVVERSDPVALDDLGPVELKGVADPVRLWATGPVRNLPTPA